jgi:hypothetical protein
MNTGAKVAIFFRNENVVLKIMSRPFLKMILYPYIPTDMGQTLNIPFLCDKNNLL